MAAPFEISLGLEWDVKKGRARRAVTYPHNRHITIFGPTRSGKGVCLEIPILLRAKGLSVINVDPKGQNFAVTSRWRKTVSKVVKLAPFDKDSAGFNPLARIDPKSPYEDCAALAEALIRVRKSDTQPHFAMSARQLMTALMMWEVKLAAAAKRVPTLRNVYAMLSGDLTATVLDMVASKDFQIAALAARYTQPEQGKNERAGVINTALTQCQWLLSDAMSADLAKDGFDFATLKDEPTTVYIILPVEKMQEGETSYSAWLRLVVVSALTALYRRGGKGLRTLFMLSEFAQLGKLDAIATALSAGAGFGIQLMPVLQDMNQLRDNFGKDAANTFLGMSGATFAFTPNDSETSEWMSKRSGEIDEPRVTVNDDPQKGPHDSWRAERHRRLSPDDLYNIPEFHGLVFFAGQSEPVPVFAPPYWDKQHNPDLIGRFDPDPYHSGSGGKTAGVAGRVGQAARRAAIIAAFAVAGAALFNATGATLPAWSPGLSQGGPVHPSLHHHPRRLTRLSPHGTAH